MEPATPGKKKNITKKTKSITAKETKSSTTKEIKIRLQRSQSSTSPTKATTTTEPGSLIQTPTVPDEYDYDSSDEEVTLFMYIISCCAFISQVLCLVLIYF